MNDRMQYSGHAGSGYAETYPAHAYQAYQQPPHQGHAYAGIPVHQYATQKGGHR